MLPSSAPPLADPTGAVVEVTTESQLQAAIVHIESGQTILIHPGTYLLTTSLFINKAVEDIAIRGLTNDPSDVVLAGEGMLVNGFTQYGLWTGGGVDTALLANMTIQGFYSAGWQVNGGTQNIRAYNLRIFDINDQFIKSPPGSDNGVVEFCEIAYTDAAPNYYTNGVDVHEGDNWIIRDCLFRNLRGNGVLAGPSVLVWNGSRFTTCERNTFINCAREIAFGIEDKTGFNDHEGGIIRNNFLYRDSGLTNMDVAIQATDSPNTKILNNTVILNGTYTDAIEYRFSSTTGVIIRNNLMDDGILARDGASGTVSNNVTNASLSLFEDPASGNLHLVSGASAAINQGVDLGDVTDDWDGQARTNGSYDLGGDERRAAPVGALLLHVGQSVTSPSPSASVSKSPSPSVSPSASVSLSLSPSSSVSPSPSGGSSSVSPSPSRSASPSASVSPSPSSGEMPLVQLSDISYLGFFNLPAQAGGTGDAWTMQYGGGGMGMGPDNTIYIAGHLIQAQKIARFNIPSIGGTATIHTNLTTVPGTYSTAEAAFGGSLVWNNRLIVTKFGKYENPGQFRASHTSASLTMTGWTTPQSTPEGRMAGGYMGVIPPEWRSAFGGPCVLGSGPRSIDNNEVSLGPSLFVFDPDQVDGSGTIAVTECLSYPLAQINRIWSGHGFYETNGVGGVAWVPNTRSVLFWGHAGAGNPQYRQPITGDSCRNGNSGFTDFPYRLAIWAYNVDDLLAVRNGSIQSHIPLPYSSGASYTSWQTPGYGTASCSSIGLFNTGSGCFDPATNRFYMCEDYGTTPRVHVWQIATF